MRSTLIRKTFATPPRPPAPKPVAPRPPADAPVAFVVKPEAVSLERWLALCG